MFKKALQIVAIIALIVLPYSTLLSNFSPYFTDNSFQTFLVASAVFAVVCLLLGWFISSGKLFKSSGILFFLLGVLVAPPLMLGTPEITPLLLQRSTEEKFRYGILMVATIVYVIGFIIVICKQWTSISAVNKLILIPFILSIPALVWDNYTSFYLSETMGAWLGSGKTIEAFYESYDFHEMIRTGGRTLVYVTVIWLSLILTCKQYLKKWVVIILTIFSLIGIVFFFLTNFIGFQFYFPFMVPAFALAPAYWLGIALLSKNLYNPKSNIG